MKAASAGRGTHTPSLSLYSSRGHTHPLLITEKRIYDVTASSAGSKIHLLSPFCFSYLILFQKV